MQNKFNRIRVWAEQGNVTIPQLFFQFYKQLQITDEEALLVMHLIAFQDEGNHFPTPSNLAQRTSYAENQISFMLQRLLQKGMLELSQGVDANGMVIERFSTYPLYERIVDLLESEANQQAAKAQKNEEINVFQMMEQELGRLLSPIELETINMWLDVDHHSPEIIKAALKEAVLAGKVSLRYIDRILFEWKKKNIQTIQQVEKQSEQFRQNGANFYKQPVMQEQAAPKTERKVSFYNWLEDRE